MKKVLAIILTIVTVFSIVSISAFAEDNTNYGKYNEPESSGDYAYWNGSKVVKSSSTTNDEIKWMQAALNFCKKNIGLSFSSYLAIDGSFGPASKSATLAFQKKYGLSQDGSFGPATIQKMKKVLDDYKKSQNKTTTTKTATTSTAKYNLIWPTTSKTVSGKYGTHGSLRGTRYHSGIDIDVSIGNPCYAVASGTVVMCKSTDDAKSTIGGRGRYIVIYHENGNYSSLYEHLNSCSVSVGSKVTAGQKIGTTGNSGWASSGKHYGPHLHFGLINGKMTTTGYDLWTVPGKAYNGKTYTNHTFEPDPAYNKTIKYTYK